MVLVHLDESNSIHLIKLFGLDWQISSTSPALSTNINVLVLFELIKLCSPFAILVNSNRDQSPFKVLQLLPQPLCLLPLHRVTVMLRCKPFCLRH